MTAGDDRGDKTARNSFVTRGKWRLTLARNGACPGADARQRHAAQDDSASVRDEDGSVIAFPQPRVADLPRGWRHWSPAEKIQHLLGMSLDDMYKILSWPIGELDPFRLSVRMQVTRVVFMVGLKAHLDGKLARAAARERDRNAVLEELDRKLGSAGD